MPRRIPDYTDAYEGWNYISSIGSIISVVATGIFLYIIYDILINQPASADDPWAMPSYFTDSDSHITQTQFSPTLEWVVPTPTPLHAFKIVPVQS